MGGVITEGQYVPPDHIHGNNEVTGIDAANWREAHPWITLRGYGHTEAGDRVWLAVTDEKGRDSEVYMPPAVAREIVRALMLSTLAAEKVAAHASARRESDPA